MKIRLGKSFEVVGHVPLSRKKDEQGQPSAEHSLNPFPLKIRRNPAAPGTASRSRDTLPNRQDLPSLVQARARMSSPREHQLDDDASGPVGQGSARLRMRAPLREAHSELVYDKAPPEEKGSMSFFRTTGDLRSLPEFCDRTGLDRLRLSGSERISSVEQIASIRAATGGQQLFVVDLRQESHVVVGGYPVTRRGKMDWANVGTSSGEALVKDNQLAEELRREQSITLPHADYLKGKSGDPQKVRLNGEPVFTEQQIVETAGAEYRRLAVTDHTRPRRETVDEFIDLIRALPNDASLHVHCNGGRGRTTTFMILYDMLRNAGNVEASKIIQRQSALGFNYKMTDIEDANPAKLPFLEDRLAFLHEFHVYATENPGGLPLNWSQWRSAGTSY